MLNVNQKRIFDKIKSHLISQKECEDLLENESSRLLRLDNIEPLRMLISGVGGTGRSFKIEAIKCLVDDIWHPKSGEIMCAIVAPTGKAAFNVGGLTIHRLFQLPIEHEGKTAGYWALNKEAQKKIKMTLKNLKIIIVDMVSMVSNLNLAYLHMHLENIFGTDEWFGCKNILFVGDHLQLPPVNGRPVFKKISNKLVKTRLVAANAVNKWKETVEYDELTIIERQKGDETFFKMLDSVRHGCLTDETIDTLKSRVFKVSIQEKYKELESLETEKIELAIVNVVMKVAAQQNLIKSKKKIRETKRSTKQNSWFRNCIVFSSRL
uniref:ATP-dependent DNA helicase n=1 Tax=Amphimedon queenslandica TaxID=400682 RepID=A0A1X7URI5_AMPQE